MNYQTIQINIEDGEVEVIGITHDYKAYRLTIEFDEIDLDDDDDIEKCVSSSHDCDDIEINRY